jgi:hypothetical protein
VHEQEEEDDAVDKEYQRLKYGMPAYDEARSLGSDDQEKIDASLPPSKQIKRLVQKQEILYNPNDEDFINKISKPMRPVKKGVLVQKDQTP